MEPTSSSSDVPSERMEVRRHAELLGDGGETQTTSSNTEPINYTSCLKHFHISVSDMWDDRNIGIFIECCHAKIEDLKNDNESNENEVWEKISKAGLEKGGSVHCFNVNYCLELAKSLKSYVTENKTTMITDTNFKRLFDDVIVLLPYFGPTMLSQNIQSDINKEDLPSLLFDANSQTSQIIKMISDILKRYDSDNLKEALSTTTFWLEVASQINHRMGLRVNPQAIVYSFKTSVANYVSLQTPELRDSIFRAQVHDLLPFFDMLPPSSIQSSEFLLPSASSSNEEMSTGLEVKKPKLDMKECPAALSSGVNDNDLTSNEPSTEIAHVDADVNLDTNSADELNVQIDSALENNTPNNEVSPEYSSTVAIDESTVLSTPAVQVSKKRGRKPKSVSAVPTPKSLPTRQSVRIRRNTRYTELTSSTETSHHMSREQWSAGHSSNSTHTRRADSPPGFRGFTPTDEIYYGATGVNLRGTNTKTPNVDLGPGTRFLLEQIAVENRRQDVWRMQNLIRLHNELIVSERNKIQLLERILESLSSGSVEHP